MNDSPWHPIVLDTDLVIPPMMDAEVCNAIFRIRRYIKQSDLPLHLGPEWTHYRTFTRVSLPEQYVPPEQRASEPINEHI
jgi:hypothetical protein